MQEQKTFKRGLTTEEFAEPLGVKGATVRSRMCRFGSYFGVTPKRLPNGRLVWSHDDLDALLNEREVA